MPTTPSWQAARNALPGNLNGTNAAAQINQFLGTHAVTQVYEGNLIYAATQQTSSTATLFYWINPSNVPSIPNAGLLPYDWDQPFVLPTGQTAIGRIQLALLPVGAAADIEVTLYPDSSGNPNLASPLASTVIPASTILNLAETGSLATPAAALATPEFNTALISASAVFNWTQPAVSLNGAGNYATPVTSGNYTLLLGGFDTVASATVNTVATIRYLGAQIVSGPVPQPALPKGAWAAMACATASTVVFAGGINGTSYLTNVWTASWDPNTGTVGSWTAQTALPAANANGGCAAWGDTVYVVGGSTAGSTATAVSSVYYASAVNGQIQSWASGPPLPQAIFAPYVAVVGDWLIVAGGQNTAGTILTATYYAPISSDGSLGGWQTGPALPVATYAYSPGWNTAVTDSAMLIVGGTVSGGATASVQVLSANADGVAPAWQVQQNVDVGQYQVAAYPTGAPGQWEVFDLHLTSYQAGLLDPVPLISVPLPASGLTAGATYHVLVHQVGGDQNNYVQLGETTTSSLNALYATRYSGGPWTAHTAHPLMLNVFDQSQGGNTLHGWVDPDTGKRAAATSTLVADHRGRLLGVCEATALPNNPLDSNPTFTSGVAPWTAVGGTITQSNAQTHGGYPYSGLLTPSGTAATSYALSEQISIVAGTWYTAQAWVYSPTGWSSVSLSVIWYDQQGNQISTYNNSVSVVAATWTQLTNTVQAPATAARAALAPAEGGTPATTNTLYLSYVTLTAADPAVLADVAQVKYEQGLWPPTSTVHLA